MFATTFVVFVTVMIFVMFLAMMVSLVRRMLLMRIVLIWVMLMWMMFNHESVDFIGWWAITMKTIMMVTMMIPWMFTMMIFVQLMVLMMFTDFLGGRFRTIKNLIWLCGFWVLGRPASRRTLTTSVDFKSLEFSERRKKKNKFINQSSNFKSSGLTYLLWVPGLLSQFSLQSLL